MVTLNLGGGIGKRIIVLVLEFPEIWKKFPPIPSIEENRLSMNSKKIKLCWLIFVLFRALPLHGAFVMNLAGDFQTRFSGGSVEVEIRFDVADLSYNSEDSIWNGDIITSDVIVKYYDEKGYPILSSESFEVEHVAIGIGSGEGEDYLHMLFWDFTPVVPLEFSLTNYDPILFMIRFRDFDEEFLSGYGAPGNLNGVDLSLFEEAYFDIWTRSLLEVQLSEMTIMQDRPFPIPESNSAICLLIGGMFLTWLRMRGCRL